MLLFIDSFDHYGTADIGDKYLSAGGSIATGRHGNGLVGNGPRLALTAGHSRLVIGAAYRCGSTFNELLTVYDINATICTFSSQNDGSLQVEMFGGPSVRSAVDVVRLNQWHYIELDLTVTTTPSGANFTYALSNCDVFVDGAQVINSTLGASIASTGAASTYGWSHIDLLPNAAATIDDVYVLDGSGASHNAPLGDVEIGVIRPNGAGAATAWAPSGAASNWDAVNDTTPDDETTKVVAAT